MRKGWARAGSRLGHKGNQADASQRFRRAAHTTKKGRAIISTTYPLLLSSASLTVYSRGHEWMRQVNDRFNKPSDETSLWGICSARKKGKRVVVGPCTSCSTDTRMVAFKLGRAASVRTHAQPSIVFQYKNARALACTQPTGNRHTDTDEKRDTRKQAARRAHAHVVWHRGPVYERTKKQLSKTAYEKE